MWAFPQNILSLSKAPPLPAPAVASFPTKHQQKCYYRTILYRDCSNTKNMNPNGYLKEEFKSVYQRRSSRVSTKLPNRIISNIQTTTYRQPAAARKQPEVICTGTGTGWLENTGERERDFFSLCITCMHCLFKK